MNHQQITKTLGNAGFVSQRITRRVRRPGYQVVQLGREVGILCGPYEVKAVCKILNDAGLFSYQKNGAASDAVFVRAE